MARTKKFLSSSYAKQGFYRPLNRLSNYKSSSSSPTSTYNDDDELPSQKTDFATLQDEINKVRALKKELEAKLQKQTTAKEEIKLQKIYPAPSYPTKTLYSHKAEPQIWPDNKEKQKLIVLEEELKESLKKERKYQQEIDDLRSQFEKEKQSFERKMSHMENIAHPRIALENNKFFMLSKELKTICDSMDQLISDENLVITEAVTTTNNPIAETTNNNISTVQPIPVITPNPNQTNPYLNNINQNVAATLNTIPNQPINTNINLQDPGQTQQQILNKKNFLNKIPKPIRILGLTFFIIILLGGGTWLVLNRKTEVDTNLVQQYLPEGAQLPTQTEDVKKKINDSQDNSQSTNSETKELKGASNSGEIQGASDTSEDKYAKSQADVAFEDTNWKTITNGPMKIEINYPDNSVNLIQTDNSLTFVRKTGYIFKIQIMETDLKVDEYYKLTKGNSLNYKQTETTFRDQPALFLELEDYSEYPGNKYLVKYKDYIYEIWYATYSKNLSDDDAKRIDIMLNSFKFLE
ncbi:hypothetical protein GYA19_01585 [Candidatus Beckwithbacteria bacterium]|nr:hypothetical protein [Candidatus Beckwithbacteria bacterium]